MLLYSIVLLPTSFNFKFDALTPFLVLDAIVVGMDMLIKKYGPTNKGKKRLCLITNALSRLRDPFEGTKEDQVCAIARQMTEQAMKLECIVVRGELSGDADKNVMDENDQLLDLFTKRTCAKTLYVENATSLLGALRTRSIAPVTIFRGDLEISSSLKIKVSFFLFFYFLFSHSWLNVN